MRTQTPLSTLTALLLTTTTITSAASTTTDFTGLGQLRTIWNGAGHEDLGCLTAAGEWTTDESRCGTFAASQLNAYTFALASVAPTVGVCGINVATFQCGNGVAGATFGTFGEGVPVAGRESLRYGEYGVFASNVPDAPPALTEPPLAIHIYDGTEQGKWVWLGWRAVDDYE